MTVETKSQNIFEKFRKFLVNSFKINLIWVKKDPNTLRRLKIISLILNWFIYLIACPFLPLTLTINFIINNKTSFISHFLEDLLEKSSGYEELCFFFKAFSKSILADQMVQWLGKPAAVPEVPGSNPG